MSAMPTTPPGKPAGRRRRTLLIASVAVLLTIGVVGYLWLQSDGGWTDALAEADRLDPGWRLEELDARRTVPAEENGAALVLAAHARLPKSWPTPPLPGTEEVMKIQQSLQSLQPPELLNARQVQYLTDELERAEQALTEARRLVDWPRGHFPVTWTPDWGSTKLGHLMDVRDVTGLLRYDALLQAHEENLSGALSSCRSAFNASRCIGAEPRFMAMVMRVSQCGAVIAVTERVLAQGVAREEDLASLQALLEEGATQPLFLIGVRGERAGLQRFAEAIESGIVPTPDLNALRQLSGDPSLAEQGDWLMNWRLGVRRRHHLATLFRCRTQLVEIAKLAEPEQAAAFAGWKAKWGCRAGAEPVTLVEVVVYTTDKFDCYCRRTQARFRCASSAVAAERFRLKQGRWPQGLAELCPGFLKDVPVDPFDGKPLRFRPLDDGVLIYSVGADGIDNGGNVQRQKSPDEPGMDIGFQFWSVAKRRQVAPAQPVEKN
jgi:hypothetical protein